MYVVNVESMKPNDEMPGVKKRVLVGKEHGARKFYLRHYTIAPGTVMSLDKHVYEHELFVIAGEGTYECDGAQRTVRAGDAIWIQSNQVHRVNNLGSEPLIVLCCRGAEEIY